MKTVPGRRRKKALLLLLALFMLIFLVVMIVRFRPLVRALATTCVANEASRAINESVDRQLAEGTLRCDGLVLLEKDAQGRITAIRTNMAEINRLKTEVLRGADEEIMELSVSEIGLPLGGLIFPTLFSGRGPRLPVRVMSVSSSDAVFSSEFEEAGINQTLHKILLDVTVTMTVLTPVGPQSVSTASQMIVAETAIIGTVPGTYMNLTP